MKVGFYDSGIGGITIFKEALKKVKTDYIYLADNLNSPYGSKDESKLKKYIDNCIKLLIDNECKIIVIACNTATMVYIDELRDKYNHIKIIGTEPAIKPAKEYEDVKFGKTLVVATSVTLNQDRFLKHLKKLKFNNKVDLISLNKLVKLIENNEDEEVIKEYLKEKFKNIKNEEYSSIVLGCTHFPFVSNIFKDLFKNAKIFDPLEGVSNYLKDNIKEQKEESNIKILLTKKDKKLEDKIYKLIKN